LKDGEVVGSGERGEIVCTNLHNYVMPLIRYQLGDLGTPIKEQCSCGRTLPLTKMLEGRSDDLLTAIDGKIIYATSFFYNLLGCLDGVKQFRVIQEKRDRLTVQLAVTEGLAIEDEVIERTAKKIQNVFGEQMQVDFRLTEEMERDATGKLRVIISRIPTKPIENQK
jgi:phenylacetate-CoA ligase